jgi:hypothetical protein
VTTISIDVDQGCLRSKRSKPFNCHKAPNTSVRDKTLPRARLSFNANPKRADNHLGLVASTRDFRLAGVALALAPVSTCKDKSSNVADLKAVRNSKISDEDPAIFNDARDGCKGGNFEDRQSDGLTALS